MKNNFFIPVALILISANAWSASYDTLPAGINTFVFKHVTTSKIDSKYDANNSNKNLQLNENFNSAKLAGISDAVNTYFNELKTLSPDAYNSFSLGEFEAKAFAEVKAEGIGLGYGLNNHITIFASLPIYHLKSNINFYQSSPSNLNSIKSAVNSSAPTTALATFVKQLTLQLPETNEELLQSVLVNYYHYKPLGTWEKDSLGDAEIGIIARLTDAENSGISLTAGIGLPTGTMDDPDSLQDIATGTGTFAGFLESNMGFGIFENKLQFDLTTRLTKYLAKNKQLRTYTDPDVPLSNTSENMKETLGNKLENSFAISVTPVNWFKLTTAYLFNQTGKTNYNTNDFRIKNALESGTNSKANWGKISLGLSTIELYKQKKFEAPLEIVLSGQKLLNGSNTAKYTRFDLDLKFYF